MSLLEIKHIQKIYSSKLSNQKVVALEDVDFKVEEGEFIAIMGESGAGKSTLLNILATLDQPTKGSVALREKAFSSLKEKELAQFRREHLGFIFQDFNLMNTLNVEDNIYLPMVLSRKPYGEMKKRLDEIAPTLNIQNLLKKYPYELSGGQKQRVAVARAVITQPDLLLADEPTGALDSHSSATLLDLFQSLNRAGQTILMVTHSTMAASKANRILFIRDGHLFHQLYRGDLNDEELYKRISDTITLMSVGGEQHV
ncbi:MULTISPECIES: ABC transporter ATP-binding protein [Terrabacteria group]|uniref:ABC transporter ATP-binding protein n=1 Tax=Bacillati TaxID=1783272 RepID=UPI001C6ED6B6|nr:MULTISPECIES: ABC transporter ATP-binding protein [Terrabacteria group]MBW9212753.1 ABC transporter ATP-binding protein [Trueperella sp. zg.1013]